MYFSKNQIPYILSTIPNTTQFVHLQIMVETELYSNSYEKIADLETMPKNNEAVFFLEEFLDNALQYDFPDFAGTTHTTALQVCKRFYVKYAFQTSTQNYSDMVWNTDQQEDFVVLLAGLEKNEFVHLRPNLLPTNGFLTKLPYLLLDRDQQAFVGYMPKENSETTIIFKVWYDNNAFHTVDLFTLLQKNQPIFFNVSFAVQNYLANLPAGRTIRQIDMQIGADVFSLLVVQNYYLQTQNEIHFVNSLGAWDSLVCTGEDEQSVEIERSLFGHYLPLNYNYTDKTNQSYMIKKTTTGVIRSGFLPKEVYTPLLGDLLQSPKVLLKLDNRYIPIEITSKKAKMLEAKDYLYAFEIAYQIV
jgi:hypothetical protein